MNKNKLVQAIAKRINTTEENIIKGIEKSDIYIYETAEEAYRDVMALQDLNHSDLIDFFLNVIKEEVHNTSPLQHWLDNYDGIITTPFGIAYIKESF